MACFGVGGKGRGRGTSRSAAGAHVRAIEAWIDEPPHVHVEKGGATAKCWLDPVEIARIQGFNPNERRRILALVGDHRDQLLESWDEFFHQNPPSGRR